jgi:adenylylsulfate kinase
VSWAIWITGLPGSGKSAVARAAIADLAARGDRVLHLEMDQVRKSLTPVPTYDDQEREVVYRALVVIARVLTGTGLPVLIDATAHRRAWRDLARAMIVPFAEVQLVCPLAVARERERTRAAGHHPRAIYARAGRSGATVPGVDVAYEPALAPELTIDTVHDTVSAAATQVADLARTLERRATLPSQIDGWAIAVSGRPGSGKTTVVAAVRERLAAHGVCAVSLDPADFTHAIASGELASPRAREIARRALVLTAALLNDAGIPVLVDANDASAPIEDLARDRLAGFAQVELECPPDICRNRERAVRWNLGAHPAPTCAAGAPDLGLGYEASHRPDLVLYTDVIDVHTAVEEILRLVDRLGRTARERRTSCA